LAQRAGPPLKFLSSPDCLHSIYGLAMALWLRK